MTAIEKLIERLASPEQWIKITSKRALLESKEHDRVDLFNACKAVFGKGERLPAFKQLSGIIREHFPDRVDAHRGPSWLDDILDVITFNNHTDTTHGDVLQVIHSLKETHFQRVG